MSISLNTFERLKDRGLAAYKAGDYAAAKPFLMQAADAIIQSVPGRWLPGWCRHDANRRDRQRGACIVRCRRSITEERHS
ncbi:MAG: hypothetical protein ACE5F9_12785 [Phycisphaerae bacterium]